MASNGGIYKPATSAPPQQQQPPPSTAATPPRGVIARSLSRMETRAPTSLAQVVLALSSKWRSPNSSQPAEKIAIIRCMLCRHDVAESDAVVLTTCGHTFCRACLKMYLETRITEGYIYPVCFHPVDTALVNGVDQPATSNSACGHAILEDQTKLIVDETTFTRYQDIRFDKDQKHTRECPYCAKVQEIAGPEAPACVCVVCCKPFCFFHGKDHKDSTCAEYQLKTVHEEMQSLGKLVYKPCPRCHHNTEKKDGCNRLKCTNCDTSFCWLCEHVIIENGWFDGHYRTMAKCGGREYDEGLRHNWAILFWLLTELPAIVIALVATPVVWLFKRSENPVDVYWEAVNAITVVLSGMLTIILTPVDWLVEIVVMVWVAIVFGVLGICAAILGLLFYGIFILAECCCGPFSDPESEDTNNTTKRSADLETGLIQADTMNRAA